MKHRLVATRDPVIRVQLIAQTRPAPSLAALVLLRVGLWFVRRGLDRMAG